MSIITDVLSKVAAMKDYVDGEIASITFLQDPTGNKRQQSQIFYDRAFASLMAALMDYVNDTSQKTAYLDRFKMGVYQSIVMATIVVENLTLQSLTGSVPGYEDITELYNCDGVFADILDAELDVAYDGPVSDSTIEPDPGEFYIIDMVARATNAELVEQSKRVALVQWLERTNVNNSSILIFEEHNGGSSGFSKREIGTNIYVDRKVKDVIDLYNLDVYIPTYVREG